MFDRREELTDMGKHSSTETSTSNTNHQPKHAQTGTPSATDAARIIGRLRTERAAGK